jgi:hypothetical protein
MVRSSFNGYQGPIKTKPPNGSWEEPGIASWNDAVAEAETRTSNEQSTFFDGFRKSEALRRGKYGCPTEFTKMSSVGTVGGRKRSHFVLDMGSGTPRHLAGRRLLIESNCVCSRAFLA